MITNALPSLAVLHHHVFGVNPLLGIKTPAQYVNLSSRKALLPAVSTLVNRSARFVVVPSLATLITLDATASLHK